MSAEQVPEKRQGDQKEVQAPQSPQAKQQDPDQKVHEPSQEQRPASHEAEIPVIHIRLKACCEDTDAQVLHYPECRRLAIRHVLRDEEEHWSETLIVMGRTYWRLVLSDIVFCLVFAMATYEIRPRYKALGYFTTLLACALFVTELFATFRRVHKDSRSD